MEKPENIKCCNCVYWEEHTDREGLLCQEGVDPRDKFGWCKRYPPTNISSDDVIEVLRGIYAANVAPECANDFIGSGDTQIGYWPVVTGWRWCGEFRASW